jgi:hypothetical protein
VEPLVYTDEEYAVPSDPAQDGALIFRWGGMEDAGLTSLLQDVLTWGANGSIVTNPNIWYMTPWYLWNYFGDSVHGASIHVEAGDTIDNVLRASDCNSAGDCTWYESVQDENTGGQATYTIGSDVAFSVVLGAVMEVPRASGCVETPANGHAAFRDLPVENIDYGFPTPDFGVSIPDSQCSVSETAFASGADILWSP